MPLYAEERRFQARPGRGERRGPAQFRSSRRSNSNSSSSSSSGQGSGQGSPPSVASDMSGSPSFSQQNSKPAPPQETIDQFWAKFTAKPPSKATKVIPRSQFAANLINRKAAVASCSPAPTTTVGAAYADAAAICRAKVEKIVKECRRVNKKYRDPHFDIEADLKLGIRDCLQSLSNLKSSKVAPPGSSFGPKSAKRVVDIFTKPRLYIHGPTAGDVKQGRDGDCWLLSALCTLSNRKGLIQRLCVAHDQDVGVYGFVFYRDGEWISEIIDDFLYLTKYDYDEGIRERILFDELERADSEEAYRKIYQSNSGALYFAQCQHPQETWLPLLEKCYAKAHGDYAAIEGGFGGEGIEDLTGGVTSEIFTTDILDKEYFWKEELLKVNEQFLFNCSTGIWGQRWGERKGIVELHAYSIQKAIEIDGKRLLRLKNPWGKGEWKGPWSDGSKEWTPEWLQKLGHRFGDDGDFWIAYEDLLQKYQAFERTRLFDDDWSVTQLWTTFTVPWMSDYSDTYFTLQVPKTGPVVIVLAQLDDRYFRGLEGEYRYQLAFRIHKAGHDDYLVRTQTPYRMTRSINVELELEQGDYEIRVKIEAERYKWMLPIEDVVRRNAKTRRREKLTKTGLAYDLAHIKGQIIETDEEKAAREQHEKKAKEKEREVYKKGLLQNRENVHYIKVQEWKRGKKKRDKKKDKMNEKRAARKAKHEESAARKKALKQETEANAAIHAEKADQSKDEAAKQDVVEETAVGEPDNTLNREAVAEPVEEDVVCESESDDDDQSVSSLSSLSEREIDLAFESKQRGDPSRPPSPSPSVDDDAPDPDAWNAVAVVGLRVFYRDMTGKDDGDTEQQTGSIKLAVVRPNPWASDKDEDDATKDQGKGRGLDVDDSAKDATLEGDLQDRKKSILSHRPLRG